MRTNKHATKRGNTQMNGWTNERTYKPNNQTNMRTHKRTNQRQRANKRAPKQKGAGHETNKNNIKQHARTQHDIETNTQTQL